MEEKTCGNCGETKPVEAFARKRGAYSSKCKRCHNKYYHEYWKNTEAYDKHKRRVSESRRKRPYYAQSKRYGLSEKEIAEILAQNDGICLICNTEKATNIDHCHATMKVRGGLCRSCNLGIGMLADDPDRLERAAEYLRGSIPSLL